MDTIHVEHGSTRMVAHRGVSGLECENTNAAFVAAGNRSYYGIETDIHRTSDGRFVVCHDDDLRRVAGENISVETTALAELQSIVLYDKDGTKGRADLRVSVLENYIGKGRMDAVIVSNNVMPQELLDKYSTQEQKDQGKK